MYYLTIFNQIERDYERNDCIIGLDIIYLITDIKYRLENIYLSRREISIKEN